MCEPATAMTASQVFYSSLAMSAATTGLNYYAQSEQAEARNEYREAKEEQTRENALESFRQQTNQEQTRVVQEQQAAAQEQQQKMFEQRKAAGQAIASSQAAGTDIDSLMGDYMRSEGHYRSAMDRQLSNTRQQSRQNIKGFQARANSRIATSKEPRAPGPSLAAAAAGLGQKATSSYQTYSRNSNNGGGNDVR